MWGKQGDDIEPSKIHLEKLLSSQYQDNPTEKVNVTFIFMLTCKNKIYKICHIIKYHATFKNHS